MTPCARDGCAADAGPLHSECPSHRVETAILERFEGGDSVAYLARDFRVPENYVEVIIRDELGPAASAEEEVEAGSMKVVDAPREAWYPSLASGGEAQADPVEAPALQAP